MKKGFTLIEALAVISIIGILSALVGTYVIGAQRTARDASRKTDLYAISQGFAARALDKTCTDQSQVGRYPNPNTSAQSPNNAILNWVNVQVLATDASCNAFSTYLSRIPTDPQGRAYYFNLNSGAAGVTGGTHFRLTALLERPKSSDTSSCVTDSKAWVVTYGGQKYGCPNDTSPNPTIAGYNYYTGQ